MQDWVADYEGEEGERAANNTGIRQKADKPAGQRAWKNKEIKFTQKTFFSDTVCPVGFFALAKTANVPF